MQIWKHMKPIETIGWAWQRVMYLHTAQVPTLCSFMIHRSVGYNTLQLQTLKTAVLDVPINAPGWDIFHLEDTRTESGQK